MPMRRSFEKLAKASRPNIAGPVPVAQARTFDAVLPADRPQVRVVLMALGLSALALAGTWLSPELAARATFLLSFAAVAGAGWYGGGFGGMTIPRIGHEVIVSFIEGDPDRPIISGYVYNGASMPNPSNSGANTGSPATSPQTLTPILCLCPSWIIRSSVRKTAQCVGS